MDLEAEVIAAAAECPGECIFIEVDDHTVALPETVGAIGLIAATAPQHLVGTDRSTAVGPSV